MHWTFEQHRSWMASEGVEPAPRTGDGTRSHPWREADGTAPRRDPERERRWAHWYLHEAQPAEHRDLLAVLDEPLPAMDPACRAAILVPCRNEVQHLPRLIDLLVHQLKRDGRPLDPCTFEIHVLLNRYADEPDDGSAESIARWRQANRGSGANLHVTTLTHAGGEPAPLTRARKVLADLALWRAMRRTVPGRPLYLLCQDADLMWLDRRETACAIARFDGDAGIDALRGPQDRCPWILVRHPLLLLARRSWNFVELSLARRSLRPDTNDRYDFNWNRRVTSGWSSGFTAEAYARICGYTPVRRFEEDMDIGEKVSCLRAYEDNRGLVPQVNTTGWLPTRAEGSPRRWLLAVATGLAPYDDRDDFDNFFRRDHERKLKQTSLPELEREVEHLTSLSSPAAVGRVQLALQADLDFVAATTPDADSAAELYGRVLNVLGFARGEATIEGGALTVHSLAGPSTSLEVFGARIKGLLPGHQPAEPPRSLAPTWRAFATRPAAAPPVGAGANV